MAIDNSRLQIDSTSRMKHGNLDPDRDHLATIPHWSGSFSYRGMNYPYTMVGTDPALGSATTTVPALIIPIRFVFADGTETDASADLIDGQTATHGIVNSPIFQPYPFVSGGTNVGNTQWTDAHQRANFWNYVSTKSKDYHVLLSPVVLPARVINVPAADGAYGVGSDGTVVHLVDVGFWDQQQQAIVDQLGVPTSLMIIVTARTYLFSGQTVLSYNYHTAIKSSAKKNSIAGAQTLIFTIYFSHSDFQGIVSDVGGLSHEINEWLHNPFIINVSPGWNFPGSSSTQCDSLFVSADALEVCDPMEGSLAALINNTKSISLNSFTYHIEDGVFLDFFTRSPHSRSVGGQYSFFGGATSPSSTCTGHLPLDFNFFSVPGASATYGQGINDSGQIVGGFQDSTGVTHGFLLQGGKYTTVDPPGAIYSLPQRISNAGLIIGLYYSADGLEHGFSYQNGKYKTLDFPGATATEANGINVSGEIVGDYYDAQGIDHGFIFNHGSYQTADVPGSPNTVLWAVNDLGVLAGTTAPDPFNGPFTGFLRAGGNYRSVQFPGAANTWPYGLNNQGIVVGQFAAPNGGDELGFVNVFGSYRAILAYPGSVNDLGQMVGIGFENGDNVVGFTAQLPPIVPGGP